MAQNKKLREEQQVQQREAERKELLAHQKAEKADLAYRHWLEVKDFKSPKPPPHECDRRGKSAVTPYGRVPACGTCLRSSPHASTSTSQHDRRLSMPTKVSHHQEKKNLESIGKPSKMQPYTNYPRKYTKLHKARVGSKASSRSQSRSSSRSNSSVGVRSCAKKSIKRCKNAGQEMPTTMHKSKSVKTFLSQVPITAEVKNQPAESSKFDPEQKPVSNPATSAVADSDPSGSDDDSDLGHSDDEVDELDFSKLGNKNDNELAYPQFEFEFDDDADTDTGLFHDVGESNNLDSLSLPAVLTKDKTPAEILQLIRHLSSSGNGKRSYHRRARSISLGGGGSFNRHYGRRFSLGSIPEGKIVMDYTEEEETSDIDSQLLRDIEKSIKGTENEEGFAGETIDPNSPTERGNSEVVESVADLPHSNSAPVLGSDREAEMDIVTVQDRQHFPPRTLKIINLAWDSSSDSVQSQVSVTSITPTSRKLPLRANVPSPRASTSTLPVNPPFLIVTYPIAGEAITSHKAIPGRQKAAMPSRKVTPPSCSSLSASPQKATPSLGRDSPTQCKIMPPSCKATAPQQEAPAFHTSASSASVRPPTPGVGGRSLSPRSLSPWLLHSIQPSFSDPCIAENASGSSNEVSLRRPPTPGIGGRSSSSHSLSPWIHSSSSDPSITRKQSKIPSNSSPRSASPTNGKERRSSAPLFFIGESENENQEVSGIYNGGPLRAAVRTCPITIEEPTVLLYTTIVDLADPDHGKAFPLLPFPV